MGPPKFEPRTRPRTSRSAQGYHAGNLNTHRAHQCGQQRSKGQGLASQAVKLVMRCSKLGTHRLLSLAVRERHDNAASLSFWMLESAALPYAVMTAGIAHFKCGGNTAELSTLDHHRTSVDC